MIKSVSNECHCTQCGGEIPTRRSMLGYKVCMECGEAGAVKARLSWCVVPMPKSNYILVTDPTLLLNLNSSHKGASR